MKGTVLLKKIEIRKFTPVTPTGDYLIVQSLNKEINFAKSLYKLRICLGSFFCNMLPL